MQISGEVWKHKLNEQFRIYSWEDAKIWENLKIGRNKKLQEDDAGEKMEESRERKNWKMEKEVGSWKKMTT